MKLNKNILVALGLLVATVSMTVAQSFDEERMRRDLKIAENILSTISNDDDGFRFYSNIESNYIKDYGVIFSIPKMSMVFAPRSKGKVIYSSGSSYVIETNDEEVDDIKIEKIDTEKIQKEAFEKAKEKISSFLVDYADLIGQLKPSERIVVQTRGSDRFYINDRRVDNGSLSGQVLKSDISAYKQGKLNREQAIGKISWTEGGKDEVAKDVELFSTIFAALYEPDISNTYYTQSRRIGYTSLENFGITFNMKVYSSSSDNGLHTIRTTRESGLTQEERDDKVNAMYPEFEETFIENLLDYGRTIKSLKANEMLMFKVNLTECRKCEMPEEIEVTVKGKTLKDYDSGSISRDKAKGQVDVKRIRD